MALRRRLPSPSALFAFEVAARVGSFSKAAEELNITQPAVSHAVATLERHLGQRLFVRLGPRLELTDAGEKLGRIATRAFVSIEEALDDIIDRDEGRDVVLLSISSGMATHWLMPRYDAFRAAFPNTDLQFQLIPGSVGGPLHNCDLGLRVASSEDSPGIEGSFAPERVLAVASASYLRDHGGLETPLRGHTLISLSKHWLDWPEFAAEAGIAVPPRCERLRFSDYAVVLQAALAGQGLALAWTSVAVRLLIDGTLLQAAPHVLVTGRKYHFVASSQRPVRPVVRDVRDWLIEQMRADERELLRILR
jgi:LysR family transcriptional regulator, glycine cleavage system transcriptional activator